MKRRTKRKVKWVISVTNRFNFVTLLICPALARNTTPQPSGRGAISRQCSSAAWAWEAFVCQKFSQNLCARRNHPPARRPAVPDRKGEAFRLSNGQSHVLV